MLEGDWTYMDDINARARLLAVEVLLAEPELLGNDALETDLYILRDRLREAATTADARGDRSGPQEPSVRRGWHGSAGCASS
jgi:hypothetical protein